MAAAFSRVREFSTRAFTHWTEASLNLQRTERARVRQTLRQCREGSGPKKSTGDDSRLARAGIVKPSGTKEKAFGHKTVSFAAPTVQQALAEFWSSGFSTTSWNQRKEAQSALKEPHDAKSNVPASQFAEGMDHIHDRKRTMLRSFETDSVDAWQGAVAGNERELRKYCTNIQDVVTSIFSFVAGLGNSHATSMVPEAALAELQGMSIYGAEFEELAALFCRAQEALPDATIVADTSRILNLAVSYSQELTSCFQVSATDDMEVDDSPSSTTSYDPFADEMLCDHDPVTDDMDFVMDDPEAASDDPDTTSIIPDTTSRDYDTSAYEGKAAMSYFCKETDKGTPATDGLGLENIPRVGPAKVDLNTLSIKKAQNTIKDRMTDLHHRMANIKATFTGNIESATRWDQLMNDDGNEGFKQYILSFAEDVESTMETTAEYLGERGSREWERRADSKFLASAQWTSESLKKLLQFFNWGWDAHILLFEAQAAVEDALDGFNS